jgi:hypothetical protein
VTLEQLANRLDDAVTALEDIVVSLGRIAEAAERLRAAIEDYLLWEPGKRGHAEAHRKLARALEAEADA